MMITERSKSVIPFRPADAARVGEGCFYLDIPCSSHAKRSNARAVPSSGIQRGHTQVSRRVAGSGSTAS